MIPIPIVIEHAEPGRRHLHDAELLARLVIDVEREAELLGVERLRPVDVRDRDEHELELQVHVMFSCA